ncbi:MAG: hypothetical protein IBX40_11180 [Methanosarcinales archaeon]|nr:hypothetical protein [Methanosarcinales archaeon]
MFNLPLPHQHLCRVPVPICSARPCGVGVAVGHQTDVVGFGEDLKKKTNRIHFKK